jgi:hypothetical protein
VTKTANGALTGPATNLAAKVRSANAVTSSGWSYHGAGPGRVRLPGW